MPTNGFSESTSCRKPTVNVVVGALDADALDVAEGDELSAKAAVGTRATPSGDDGCAQASPLGAVHRVLRVGGQHELAWEQVQVQILGGWSRGGGPSGGPEPGSWPNRCGDEAVAR